MYQEGMLVGKPMQTAEPVLRERLERAYGILQNALDLVNTIDGKLFQPTPCNEICPKDKYNGNEMDYLISEVIIIANSLETALRRINEKV